MELGIFSKTYEGDLETVFRRIQADGLTATQFNLTTAGLETMPLVYNKDDLDEVKRISKKYNIKLAALSGTFNMIDPDSKARNDGIKRFRVLCEIANYLNIPVISLCTGSKNPNDKWAWDDRNLKDSSWNDLLKTTKQIINYAKEYNVVLGVEPEVNNIINTPKRARKYLDIFKSKHLKIIMDGANLFIPTKVEAMQETLKEAFDYLGNDICLAHAKDLCLTSKITFVAAGEGAIDFKTYIKLLNKYNYKGPLIIHGLSETQVLDSVEFLKGEM